MPASCYDNRELSWLKFNARVLEEASDVNNPLLERLTFASIFQSNLDEFYMIRVGTLHDAILLKKSVSDNKTGMSSIEQLDAICKRTSELIPLKNSAYKDIMTGLAPYEVEQVSFKQLNKDEADYITAYYSREIKPLISPQVIDKRHPFPFLQNKAIFVAAELDVKGSQTLGIIPAQGAFPRMVFLPSKKCRFMLAEELILHFASDAFGRYRVTNKALMRITRNADIDADEALYDHDIDFRDMMEELVRRRKKLAPVRLELSKPFSKSMLDFVCRSLGMKHPHIFIDKAPLDLSFVFALKDRMKDCAALFYPKFELQPSADINESEPMMKQIERGDILLSYPFESIKPFIRLLNEAADDSSVTSVKITLYRVAKNSQVVAALVRCAEKGKDVMVCVELRARFDEENNIEWSHRLEEAGCKVIYGPEGLKVHSKLLLITRRTGQSISYITQIGTGNYNEKTAALYTDLSLMTADSNIGAEAGNVFNALSVGSLVESSAHLLVAPLCLQNSIVRLIDYEISTAQSGSPAYIGLKLNSLTDKILMDKLIEASCAGVKIQLVVRGICCLTAGVDGMTENISVSSIVGRFLEHSRIYIFGTRERSKIYIASADFMTRNTLRRVEVAAPVLDEKIKQRILTMFDVLLSDTVKSRRMLSSGNYVRKATSAGGVSSQDFFMEEARARAETRNEKISTSKGKGALRRLLGSVFTRRHKD